MLEPVTYHSLASHWEASECLCLGDDCASRAAEQTKPGSGVCCVIKPLRVVDQVVSLYGTCWAFKLAWQTNFNQARCSSSVASAGPEGSEGTGKSRYSTCATPAWPAGPAKTVSVGPLLPMPYEPDKPRKILSFSGQFVSAIPDSQP